MNEAEEDDKAFWSELQREVFAAEQASADRASIARRIEDAKEEPLSRSHIDSIVESVMAREAAAEGGGSGKEDQNGEAAPEPGPMRLVVSPEELPDVELCIDWLDR